MKASSRARHLQHLLYGGMAAALIAPGAALAQAVAPADAGGEAVGLAEVVVTAQRRAENLQDVPIAVAAVTAEALERTGVDTTRDLPQIVPSVQFTRSGASGLFFVRGVGTTNAAVGEEGANAVYIDNVYLADLAQSVNNFNNIERVEVLKGPQGTLFGRNATGGLIHIITREPGSERVIEGEAGIANYQTKSARLYMAAPLTEQLSADLALTGLDQGEGWGRNLTLNRENKIQEYWGARSKLVFRPNTRLKFVLAGDYFQNKDNLTLGYKLDPEVIGTGGFRGPGEHDTTLNDEPLTEQDFRGVSLTGQADLGFATLTSITAGRRTRNTSRFDVDGGPAPLIRIAFTSGLKSFQQELRLASNETEPFSWQVGLFYLRTESVNDALFSGAAFPAILRGQQVQAKLDSESYAAFGEGAYSITPQTRLTLGVRYTKDKRSFLGRQSNVLVGGGVLSTAAQDSGLDYGEWTYRAALRHEFTDQISAYASINRGFKSGSYSLQNPLNAPYLPQFIMAYEVGVKSELWDRRLRLNASAYHYDIDDYQVRSAATGSPGSSLILNAATVQVDGVDVEFEAAPTDALRVFGGFTWLNARFDQFGGRNAAAQAPIVYPNPASCPTELIGSKTPGVLGAGGRTGGFTTCFGDVSGNATPNSPDFSASLGVSYTASVGDGELRLSTLYSYNSGYVFEADNIARQDAYSLLNASIEYRPVERFGIELWARNLADVEYAVQKISTPTGTTVALGAPRTYGVNLKFAF